MRCTFVLCATALSACASAAPVAPTAPEGSGPAALSSAESPAPLPADSAKAPEPPADGLKHFLGVRFQVPEGWTYALEKDLALAKSPTGTAGFLIAGYDDVSRSTDALHRAEREFQTRFPVDLGQPITLNRLKLLLSTSMTEVAGGKGRASVMKGAGPKTALLILFTFAKAPTSPTESATDEGLKSWAESIDVDAP